MAPPTDSGAGVKSMDPSSLFFSPDDVADNDVEREYHRSGQMKAQKALMGDFETALNIMPSPSPPRQSEHTFNLANMQTEESAAAQDGIDLGGNIKLEFPSLKKYPNPRDRYKHDKEVMLGRWHEIDDIKPPKEPLRAPRVRLPPPKNWPMNEIQLEKENWKTALVKSNLELIREVLKKTVPFANRSHKGYTKGEDLEEEEARKMRVLNLSYQDLSQQYHLDEFHQKLSLYWRVRVLTLTDNKLKDLSMFEFPKLEALYLDRNDFREIGKLPSCPRLLVLKLSYNEIWYDGIDGLVEYPRLEELVLRGCPIAQESEYVYWVGSYAPRSLQFLDDRPMQRKTCFRGRKAMHRFVPCLPSSRSLMFWKKWGEKEADEDWEIVYARKLWSDFDEDGNGHLDVGEVVKLIDALNLDVGSGYVQQCIDSANTDGDNVLTFNELLGLLRKLRLTEMMIGLFDHYSKNGNHLTPKEFQAFLHGEQSEDPLVFQEKTVRTLVSNIQPATKEAKKKGFLYMSGFSTYMRSWAYNDSLDPSHMNKITDDMTRPLASYFISSSHNSYLVTDHLDGSASGISIQEAFLRHAKCIKLDIFNGENGKPQVRHHQGSPESSVPLSDILVGIPDFAFVKSPFPVILVLELHCDVKQQELVALQLLEHLGQFLHSTETPLSDGRKPPALPSPDDLRGKILIKLQNVDESSVFVEGEVAVDQGASYFPKGAIAKRQHLERTLKGGAGEKKRKELAMSKHDLKELFEARMNTKKPTAVLNSDLYALANFRSFYLEDLNAMSRGDPHDVLTITEDELEDLTDERKRHLQEWAKYRLVILEPRASRIGATSQDPCVGWQYGIQCVSMGFHLLADPLSQLNMGRFRINSGSGYLLKPMCMSDQMEMFNPKTFSPPKYRQLVMRIMSGHEIPRIVGSDNVSPYVKVELKGFVQDQTEMRTETVKNNGFNPVFEQKFTIPMRLAELDVLRLTVVDEDAMKGDQVIAESSMSVMAIRSGYRHVGLKDMDGNWIKGCCLIAHFEWETLEEDSFARRRARRGSRRVVPNADASGKESHSLSHSLAVKALKQAGSTVELPDAPSQKPITSPRDVLSALSPRQLLDELKGPEHSGQNTQHAPRSGLVQSLQEGRQEAAKNPTQAMLGNIGQLPQTPRSTASTSATPRAALMGSFEKLPKNSTTTSNPHKALMGSYSTLPTEKHSTLLTSQQALMGSFNSLPQRSRPNSTDGGSRTPSVSGSVGNLAMGAMLGDLSATQR